MQKLEGEVQGPLLVEDDVEIDGTLLGGATVVGTLDLRGTIHGDLVVAAGGHADIEAVVHGRVRVAEGGRLRLRGIVAGAMGLNKLADVGIAVGTVVDGRQLQEDGSFTVMVGPQDIRFHDDTLVLRLDADGRWVPAREVARRHPDRTTEMPRVEVPGRPGPPTPPAHVEAPPPPAPSRPRRGRHAHPDDD